MNFVMGGRGQTGYVMAQGRGGGAFSPMSLNPALWLDASQITGLSDGAAIATWTDASGNIRNGTQATADKRPTYKSAIVGGEPVARFDANDNMQLAISLPSGSWTVFAVHSGPGLSTGGRYLMDAETGRLLFGIRSAQSANDTDITYYDGAWRDIAAGITGWQINAWRLDAGASSGAIFRNGASLGTAAYTARAIGGAVSLGSRYSFNSDFMACDLAEIIVYDSALSDINRQAVEAYLSAKYGIALA